MTHAEDTTSGRDAAIGLLEKRPAAKRLVKRDPKNPDAYWDAQKRYITGTKAARLAVGEFFPVWEEMMGRVVVTETEAMTFGKRLEGFVADEFASRHPEYRVRQVHALLGHPRVPWMAGSIDRLLYGPADGPYVLEIKTTGQTWETIPERYLAQIAWYLAVVGAPRALLAVLVRGQHLEEYVIEADPALQTALFNLAAAFWARVQTHDPPPLDASEAARRWLTRVYHPPARDTFRSATAEEAAWVDRYAALTARRADLQQELEAVGVQLRAAIGEYKGVTGPGWRATWIRKTVRRTDLKQMRKDHPEWTAPYTEERPEDGGLSIHQTKEARA